MHISGKNLAKNLAKIVLAKILEQKFGMKTGKNSVMATKVATSRIFNGFDAPHIMICNRSVPAIGRRPPADFGTF